MRFLKTFADSLIHIFRVMHKEGYIFAAISAVIFLVFSIVGSFVPFFFLGLIVTFAIMHFFRDTNRMVPMNSNIAVSTADGVIGSIAEEEYLCAHSDKKKKAICIRILLSITDGHINRSPIDGVVKALKYTPGSFESILSNNIEQAKNNEKQEILIEDGDKREFLVVQQVGMLARRIVCNLIVGQSVARGERIGLMKFGSMMAIYLPEDFQPNVVIGQTVVAGETIIAVNAKSKIELSYKEI
ncbi:phosphatidylserine decarboxylase [Anaplasmataceae bacterium AB001_6]|nr:phosphatidylserine decarboxylase [Anaplasmataceae bacterium AB001_6]